MILLGATVSIFFVSYFIWQIFGWLYNFSETRKLKKFEKDLELSIKHSQPSWEEIKNIANTRLMTHKSILAIILEFQREVLSGRKKELEPYKEALNEYLKNYKNEEPFEGLPNEIRLQLERLRKKIDGKEDILEPLTSQIKELLLINEREKRHQKYYTVAGFFVGVIGLLFAAYSSFIDV